MIRFLAVASPIGRLLLSGEEEGVRGIAFRRTTDPADPYPPGSARGSGADRPFREAIRQLGAYFAGELREFDLPLVPAGTPFQLEVWSMLRTVPYGGTTSYGELARRLGNASASRAVGAANGRNPIPIVVPCHRVIGANGSLTGFGGGLPIKRRLLALESGQRHAFECKPSGDPWTRMAVGSP